MALTRAGKKRELEKSSGTNDGGTQTAKKMKTAKADTKSSVSAAQKKTPAKGLLEMPPEIRNRIYDYASECDNFEDWYMPVPLVYRYPKCCGKTAWPLDPDKPSARKFLGLTQTCRQLRGEYRPIWLRNASVRVTYSCLRLYLHTFYGCILQYQNMPKLLQVSLDHDEAAMIEISQLLRIHAHCSATKIEFIPHVLTQAEGPWTDDSDCFICESDLSIGSLTIADLEEGGCSHLEERFENYADFIMLEEYAYLPSLNDLMSHDNSKWLEDIRDNRIGRVKIDLEDRECPDMMIRVDPRSEMIQKKQHHKSVAEVINWFIESRGLLFEALYTEVVIGQDI